MSANMFGYAGGGVVPERARLGVQQGADVRRRADRAGRLVRRAGRRLHAAARQRAPADRHAAGRHAELLRLDLAVPRTRSRVYKFHVDWDKHLALDVHRPGHSARRRRAGRTPASANAPSPGGNSLDTLADPGDGAEPVHATSAASSRCGTPTRCAGAEHARGFARAVRWYQVERHRRHGRREHRRRRRRGTRTAPTS